jgi:hypothetical protein
VGLGIYDNTGLGVSEFAVPTDSPKIVCSVPLSYLAAQGQMDFLKRGAPGGEIYIGLAGKKPSALQYDIVLNDTAQPFFDVDGLVLGDVWVFANQAGLNISIFIGICSKGT